MSVQWPLHWPNNVWLSVHCPNRFVETWGSLLASPKSLLWAVCPDSTTVWQIPIIYWWQILPDTLLFDKRGRRDRIYACGWMLIERVSIFIVVHTPPPLSIFPTSSPFCNFSFSLYLDEEGLSLWPLLQANWDGGGGGCRGYSSVGSHEKSGFSGKWDVLLVGSAHAGK